MARSAAAAARTVAPKGNRAQDRSGLFDERFLKTLEHLHMVSRKMFAGNLRAERRTRDEPEAEGSPQQAEQPWPFGRLRDIGDCRLRDRHARARGAVDEAAEEQQGQRTRGSGQEAARRRAEQRDQDDGLAADAVGDPAPHRREKELGDREGRCGFWSYAQQRA